jgi:type I restriction enzyme S subunit
MADVLRGRSYTSAELRDEGGRAFVNLKCIDRFGGFRDHGLKGIEGDFKDKHMVSPGDIVMAVTDMTRDAMIVAQSGRISKTVEADAIFSMDLVKIVPKPDIERDWLYSLLRFSRFAFDVREHANGTNVLHLKPKYIEEWKGILPPTKVRGWFAELVQPIFEQIDNLQLQSRNAARARDLLLPKLMNGTLTV